ncbi:MAG: alginate lyase family protein [Anaerolineales bacterium]|nr:alginate lyase family protein [Anaerolineales bacterium]
MPELPVSSSGLLSRVMLVLKALGELGPRQAGLFAWYKLLLHSGTLRAATRSPAPRVDGARFHPPLQHLPTREALRDILGTDGIGYLIQEADEITSGHTRLFGGPLVALELTPARPLLHWTAYETGHAQPTMACTTTASMDWKFVWEPARFGWATILARAYHICGEEVYAQAFWKFTETFLDRNPAYQGPNWMSAQEVALRLIALVFCGQVLAPSRASTAPRMQRLGQAIAEHARRIPPTLAYARAQNNNHLLSEAAGLYTAAQALPDHPHAKRWERLGIHWLNAGLQGQIAADGCYSQHSINYHRLMLQLAIWVDALAGNPPSSLTHPVFQAETRHRLAAATRWLLRLVDCTSGGAPNLGPNDGAYILPLSITPPGELCGRDYRPVLQAAGITFLGERQLASGAWDEMTMWLVAHQRQSGSSLSSQQPMSHKTDIQQTPHILHNPASDSWAYLRVARFTSRPGHADQLHLDLWWHGFNIAQDAGTYRYTAEAPWNNSLAHTAVHNTLLIDDQEQMTRAGRFLYLDWAQAEVIAARDGAEGALQQVTARHEGYRRLEVSHQRSVEASTDGRWLITDQVTGRAGRLTRARLHWLLPDWEWKVEENLIKADQESPSTGSSRIALHSPLGEILLEIAATGQKMARAELEICRGGEVLYGSKPCHPSWGWVSPTYGVKTSALSISLWIEGELPIEAHSTWIFSRTRPKPMAGNI